MTSAPLYDLTAPDGIQHTIWRTEPEVGAAIVAAFAQVPALYIADGHHRAASAARAHLHFAQAAVPVGIAAVSPGAGVAAGAAVDATADEHAWFLAVAFPDHQTQILPYHRVVKDLAGQTSDAFLAALRAKFPVMPGPATPFRKGDCAMYLAGTWYTVQLGQPLEEHSDAITARPGEPSAADPIRTLDVSRLQSEILTPLLHVGDPRTDKRIEFVGGIRGTGELERIVDRGDAAVAFALFPTTVDELMAIADAGGIMPPKSTWFEPKLRDGLLTHII